jgi:hypothetical protein
MSRPVESTPEDRIAALHAIRDRFPGNVASAQETRLLVAMQELGHCTTFEASRFLDVYHPPARKLALLSRGHRIVMTWRRVVTESGKAHRIGVYSLLKGGEPNCPNSPASA